MTEQFEEKKTISQKQSEFQKITQMPDQLINDLVLEIENAAREFLGNADTKPGNFRQNKIIKIYAGLKTGY